MKKIFLYLVLSFALVSCETTSSQTYNQFKIEHGSNWKYAKVCAESAPYYDGKYCAYTGRATQSEANQAAFDNCHYSDCVLVMEGNKTVYTKGQGNKVQMATLIEESKSTCKSLGFKEGTEKFTDCSLKLYSQKLDLAVKQSQQVVVQNQGSSTVRVIDVTREREDTMRRSMGLINGTCTLATYYSC